MLYCIGSVNSSSSEAYSLLFHTSLSLKSQPWKKILGCETAQKVCSLASYFDSNFFFLFNFTDKIGLLSFGFSLFDKFLILWILSI